MTLRRMGWLRRQAVGITLAKAYLDSLKDGINAAAFAGPTDYTYGTVRRTFSAVRKPGIQNVDYSMIKHTRINEKLDTEFHAQAFNSFNNPHFANPAMAEDVAGLGVITSTLNSPPPRQLQFALKLIF